MQHECMRASQRLAQHDAALENIAHTCRNGGDGTWPSITSAQSVTDRSQELNCRMRAIIADSSTYKTIVHGDGGSFFSNTAVTPLYQIRVDLLLGQHDAYYHCASLDTCLTAVDWWKVHVSWSTGGEEEKKAGQAQRKICDGKLLCSTTLCSTTG